MARGRRVAAAFAVFLAVLVLGGSQAEAKPGKGGGGLADSSGQVDAGEGSGGTANPLSMRNPLCGRLDGEAATNCRYGEGPESPYPASNYGLDIYADDSGSASDAIVGNFQKMLAAIANAIWMLCIYALRAVFTFVGWAFSTAPFTNDRATNRVDSGLESFYANFTEPWLVFGFVCLGAWAVWRGLVKREVTQSASGVLLSVGLMLAALWVLHEPRESVGRASTIVDKAAVGVIAAPQDRSLSDPEGSYAGATERAWEVMTTAPFAALQFSDTGWALGKPDPALKEYVWDDTERYCSDAAFVGSRALCERYRAALGEPRSNAELLLAASPGSAVRSDEMWNHFDGEAVQEKMAMQGGGGAWLRLPLVLLFAIGLLGALLLFAWIAIRLFVQTAIAFVLVLSAPLALFFPVFGERGRAAFGFWGASLLGAIVAKLIYAALLAIVLFGTSVIFGMVSSSDRGITVTMGFLLAAGFWWATFLKRQEIAGFFSLTDKGGALARGGAIGGGGVLGALGAYSGYRLGRSLLGAAGGRLTRQRGRNAPFGTSAGAPDRSREPRTTDQEQASAQLDARATERLERQYADAKGTAALADRERAGVSPGAARRARAHVDQVADNERRTGRRFTPAEVAESREAIRHNLNQPVSSGAHAHYVGMSPREYEALSGREREDAHRRVAARIKEDKAAFGVIPDRPSGVPTSRRDARAYRRVRAESLGGDAFRAERRAAQQRQRERHAEERRARRMRARRRGISR
jgi:hypothetical protein